MSNPVEGYMKAITYTGQKIKGPVDISYKIDGVRILYRNGKACSWTLRKRSVISSWLQ